MKKLAATLTVSAVLLAACGNTDDHVDNANTTSAASSQADTTTATSSATTTSPEASAAANAKEAEPANKDGSNPESNVKPMGTPSLEDRTVYPEAGSDLTPKAIRTAHHPGFDRLTIEFEGNGPVGWYTRMMENPKQQASGHDIPYEGVIALDLGVEMTPYPIDNPAEANNMLQMNTYPGTTGNGGIITGVEYKGIFEARSQFIIGLNKKVPYSMTFLEGPPRVVIDFQTE